MRVKRFIDNESENPDEAAGHVCGLIVRARPEKLEPALRGLAELPGVEVHQTAPDGRIIVTIEDTTEESAGKTMHRLYDVEGVVSASLVYHHHDDPGETEGEASL